MSKSLRKDKESPKNKLSRIEENDSSEEEQDEDDIFLQDLERENQMLEGVLKDLQGVIKKDKSDYSFEKSPTVRDKHHFTSVRRLSNYSPKGDKSQNFKRESRIPRPRGSVDLRESKKKHNFNPSDNGSRERPHSSRRPYTSQTLSSMIRNSSHQPFEDEEQESMELQPPVPHNHIKIRDIATPNIDTEERSA